MSTSIEAARVAFERQAWREACRAFEAASVETALGADDYEQLAVASYLGGDDIRCFQAWEAAYRAALDDGDLAAAARTAVLLALGLVLRGQMAHAGGWVARAEELLDERSAECAASGYVLIPKLLGALEGDSGTAADLAAKAMAHRQALRRRGPTGPGCTRAWAGAHRRRRHGSWCSAPR